MVPPNETDFLTQDEKWKSLAVQAQEGNKRAYSQLLHEILPYIKNVIRGGLANPDWVEDIAQEVLISVHKSLNTYSPDRSFTPWLMAIINFRKTDFLRKHYRGKKTKESVAENTDIFDQNVTNPSFAGEWKDIETALQELPDNQRKIFEMMKLKGYSAKEVADEMGMTVSAVKVSAHRTANKLKERLE